MKVETSSNKHIRKEKENFRWESFHRLIQEVLLATSGKEYHPGHSCSCLLLKVRMWQKKILMEKLVFLLTLERLVLGMGLGVITCL